MTWLTLPTHYTGGRFTKRHDFLSTCTKVGCDLLDVSPTSDARLAYTALLRSMAVGDTDSYVYSAATDHLRGSVLSS